MKILILILALISFNASAQSFKIFKDCFCVDTIENWKKMDSYLSDENKTAINDMVKTGHAIYIKNDTDAVKLSQTTVGSGYVFLMGLPSKRKCYVDYIYTEAK